jgi:DNA repair exonuclease SbcCD ATPase subunit
LVRFAGQIRVPEVDHPGVPATFLVDENQAEVILEGEFLGRWSLFDAQVDRLVSRAFQVDLAGEEITFLADEPVDFAYKGVEHMAEVWARYKTMTLARRLVAIRRSCKGTTPSRLVELREAMLENLAEEQRGHGRSLAGEIAALNNAAHGPAVVVEPEPDPAPSPFADSPIEDRSEHLIPMIPSVGETTGDQADQLAAARAASELEAGHVKATDVLAAERQTLEAERAQVEEQRIRLDEALAEAERLEAERLQAARLDMERLEADRRSLEQRHETERLETERLEAERKELKTLDAERVKRERAKNERFEAQREELERLEAAWIERERIESDRFEKERLDLEQTEAARAKVARFETERLEAERKELERLEVARLEAEKNELKRLETEKAELEAPLLSKLSQ